MAAGKFAKGTEVSVERSRIEIEQLLKRYGATAFSYATMETAARVQFIVNQRGVQFDLPLPDPKADEFTRDSRYPWKLASKDKAAKKWEQACRSRWRALRLTIQARLEAVECGIESFEVAFLAHLMLPNGKTVREQIVPAIMANKTPTLSLLGGPSA